MNACQDGVVFPVGGRNSSECLASFEALLQGPAHTVLPTAHTSAVPHPALPSQQHRGDGMMALACTTAPLPVTRPRHFCYPLCTPLPPSLMLPLTSISSLTCASSSSPPHPLSPPQLAPATPASCTAPAPATCLPAAAAPALLPPAEFSTSASE